MPEFGKLAFILPTSLARWLEFPTILAFGCPALLPRLKLRSKSYRAFNREVNVSSNFRPITTLLAGATAIQFRIDCFPELSACPTLSRLVPSSDRAAGFFEAKRLSV